MSAGAAAPTGARRWRPESVFGWIAALLFSIAGAFVLPRVGISWDEPTERTRGELLIDYWSSGGRDRAVLEHLDSAYYGNLFVATATLAERVATTIPWHLVWHTLVLLSGALGVGLAARLAGDFAGARAAGLAALLLATTPRWFGHSLFNPKDVPFAATYALAVLALTRLAAEGSRPRAATWAVFGATVGLACAIRMAGLVLLPLGALVVSSAWIGERPAAWRSALAGLAGGSLLAAGASAAVLLPFWPLLHRAPLDGLLDILSVQASFPWYSKVLFAGEWVSPRAIVHAYLPTWLWIGLPLGWAVGLAAAPFARLRPGSGDVSTARRRRLAVALAATLPVAFVVLRGVPLYDGLRQMLFVLPPLAALAATGWRRLLDLERPPLARGLAAALLALLVLEPVAWLARTGSLAYTYVQPLAGEFAAATWRYDSDYWALGLRPVAGELDRLASSRSADDPLRVRVVRPGYLKRSMAPFLADPARVRWLGPDNEPAEVEVVVGRWLRGPVPDTDEVLFRSEIVPGQRPFAYLRRAARRPDDETTAISSTPGSPSSPSSTDPGISP